MRFYWHTLQYYTIDPQREPKLVWLVFIFGLN